RAGLRNGGMPRAVEVGRAVHEAREVFLASERSDEAQGLEVRPVRGPAEPPAGEGRQPSAVAVRGPGDHLANVGKAVSLGEVLLDQERRARGADLSRELARVALAEIVEEAVRQAVQVVGALAALDDQ